jgi:hypothetical protein
LVHDLVAKLESSFNVTAVTQNIDNLHEQAGSIKIIHLPGEILMKKLDKKRATKIVAPNKSSMRLIVTQQLFFLFLLELLLRSILQNKLQKQYS